MVEQGGGRFIIIQQGKQGVEVLFEDPQTENKIRLYVSALKSPDDVREAIRSKREHEHRKLHTMTSVL